MNPDSVLQHLKEMVARLHQPVDRVTTPPDTTFSDARESIRELSRSRVSLMLRQLRAVHGFSYEEVQEKSGLSQQLLFDVEYKDRRLRMDQLGLLADCYGVSPGDILGIELEDQ